MGNFLGKFSYTFSITIQYATVFPIKNKFWPVILTFYFDLVPPIFTFYNEIAFSQPLYQFSVSHVTTSTTYYHGKCVLIYKLKDFCWWNFDTQFECTQVPISKLIKLRSPHLINTYSFWNYLSKSLLLIRLIIITLF